MSPIEDLTAWVKSQALELGFDDVGIASATAGTPHADNLAQAKAEGRFGPLDYMERTFEERSDILKLMPEAKSVVVVLKNYHTGHHQDFVSEETLKAEAKISRYAWGRDYHQWFKKRLRKFRKALELEAENPILVHIFNDTGPVLERAWAEKAGLGFIGKSGLLINRKFGTWTFIGGFVTDVDLLPDDPWLNQNCGSCTRCQEACPTQALVAPGKLDARLCISTWNIERPLHKDANQDFLKGHAWALGCDRCQEVCPWNKFEMLSTEERFQPLEGRVTLTAARLPKDMSGTALARPKKAGLLLSIDRAMNAAK